MEPQGKVAVVTGGALGIGKGIARRLGHAGAAVVIADINEDAACRTVREFEDAGLAACFAHTDVAKDHDLQRMIEFAEDQLALDILVNNAGAGGPPFFPAAEPDAWSEVLHVYLRQMMLGTQLAIWAMDSRGGVVVNIASAAGVGFAAQAWPEYAAAKAGIMRFTAAIAEVTKHTGVRVNCICPGWVATEAVRGYLSKWTDEQKRERDVPDPMLTPEEIGDSVLELVRDSSLARRVMLHPNVGERKLIPIGADY